MHNNQHNLHSSNLVENLETNDLKRLVHPELHIDEYKSKMGDDADICVLSFKVSGKEPANDLVNFLEKGFDFILDADVSSGEKIGGDYLVFVEVDRTSKLPAQIVEMMEDIMNLTEQDVADWRVRYHTSTKDHDVSEQELTKIIPLTPEAYTKKFEDHQRDLDAMKATAGVPVDTTAPVNDLTESLRIAAGLK